MIYIVGVDHMNAQRRRLRHDLTEHHDKFRSTVESAIKSLELSLLAEEDHPEYLNKNEAQSILIEIARNNSIRHQFVDPDATEREMIGYHTEEFIRKVHGVGNCAARAHEIAHQFPKREAFWLSKIRPSLDANILFVCGAGHVESFGQLLTKSNVQVSVLAAQIGIDPCEWKLDRKFREYIDQHPKEFHNPRCFCHSQHPIPSG